MEHRVVITKSQSTINDWLDKGWKVVSVTAQYIVSSSWNEGAFCFVLSREIKE
jgi:hypothetical protein